MPQVTALHLLQEHHRWVSFFDMELLEARDADQNQSVWRLLASYSAVRSHCCMLDMYAHFMCRNFMHCVDACRLDALDQWCLRTLLGLKWHQSVRNDEVRRITKQSNLMVIIQSRRLSLFGHIARMDDDADAKMILTAPPSEDWRRPPGRPCTKLLNTIQRDLRTHNLTLNEVVNLAQNRPLWRVMVSYSSTHA